MEDARVRLILEEASRCIYCGFCEAVCPTRPFGRHRGYGPRGRLRISLQLARGNAKPTKAVIESLYTCLLCAACNMKCPAMIDIAGAIRAARSLANPLSRRADLYFRRED